MMRKKVWHMWGNGYYQTASVSCESVNVVWYILDQLLARHPHWGWWTNLWSKLNPYWGDPFCAAYCLTWSNFYDSKLKVEFSANISFDRLPEEFRDELLALGMEYKDSESSAVI